MITIDKLFQKPKVNLPLKTIIMNILCSGTKWILQHWFDKVYSKNMVTSTLNDVGVFANNLLMDEP